MTIGGPQGFNLRKVSREARLKALIQPIRVLAPIKR